MFDNNYNRSLGEQLSTQDNGLISEPLYAALSGWITIAMLAFSFLGVITNIINIRVFLEQGVTTSSTNIGLLALSVFDLVACLLQIMPAFCAILFPIGNRNRSVCSTYSNLPNLIYPTMYHCNAWTTVYLSLERSLCVLLPLRVKVILRPKVTALVIISIFTYFLAIQAAQSVFLRIIWIVHPIWNYTMPRTTETPVGATFRYYISLINNQILSSTAIFIVTISTIVMIRTLHKFQKWRQSHTNASVGADISTNQKSSGKKQVISSKDAEMVKSVMIATCIFLVCLAAGRAPDIIILTTSGATLSGKNRNVFKLGYVVRILFSTINSSINFFFYIRMSSRYKEAFAAAFQKLNCFGSTSK